MISNIDNIIENINSKKYEDPVTTKNQFADVIKWLANGDIVVLYNQYGQLRVYHNKCQENTKYDDRICCIDCKKFPGLLDDGEWNWYIENAKNQKCTCNDLINVVNTLIKKNAKNVYLYET